MKRTNLKSTNLKSTNLKRNNLKSTRAKNHPDFNEPKRVHVAVGVVERVNVSGQREILIAKRPEGVHQGGLWEFPGGKVEVGETVLDALSRELFEELGITVSTLGGDTEGDIKSASELSPLIQIEHDYGDKLVLLDVWQIQSFEGIPEGKEGQPVKWVLPKELQEHAFPEANQPIIKACNLPRQFVITPEYDSFSRAEADLARLLGLGVQLILFRQPQLEENEYRQYVVNLLESLPGLKSKLLLSGDPEQMAGLGVRGLQLPFRLASGLCERPLPTSDWLGVSCHNETELAHAELLGADFVTLSPVQRTLTHPDKPELGWATFQAMAKRSKLPVFALGGLQLEDFDKAVSSGAQGVAGIRLWQG